GLVSWKFVEQPCRRAAIPKPRVATLFIAGSVAAASLFGAVAFWAGLPGRIPAPARAIASLDIMWEWQCRHPSPTEAAMECEIGSPWESAPNRIFIWGDSHMVQFLPLMAAAVTGHDVSVRSLGGCSPIIDGIRIKGNVPTDPTYNAMCNRFYTGHLK